MCSSTWAILKKISTDQLSRNYCFVKTWNIIIILGKLLTHWSKTTMEEKNNPAFIGHVPDIITEQEGDQISSENDLLQVEHL